MNRFSQKSAFTTAYAWKLIKFLSIALAVLIIIVNYKAVNHWLGEVFSLFAPIIAGLVLAYLLNPFFRIFERKVFYRMHPMGVRRAVSLLCTYISLLLILALLVLLILPQLYSSIANFINNYESYLQSALFQYNRMVDWFGNLLDRLGIHHELQPSSIEKVTQGITSLLLGWDGFSKLIDTSVIYDASSYLFAVLSKVISAAFDIVCTFFISLYMLASKEQRYAQVMRMRRALFSDSANAKMTHFFEVTDRSFGGFLEGKVIDSLIIGVLTYVVVVIFRIPYPILMAAIVGITNVIPIIGPIIGAVPTSIIILLTDPAKFIPFLIIVFVIQQIDGNIIGPKILGNNTGVSSLCVLIAITVMGNIWGLIGMILGVPVFATILELTDDAVEKRLRAKGISAATENFYPVGSMVDPAKDIQNNTDKTLRIYEKKVLQMQKKLDAGLSLSRMERILFSIYSSARKIKLFPEMSDEVLADFAAENGIKAASDQAKKELKQLLSVTNKTE